MRSYYRMHAIWYSVAWTHSHIRSFRLEYPIMMKIVLATRNPGKIREMRRLLADLPVEVASAEEFSAPDVEEDADTLEGNALKKARALFQVTGLPSLADDTGLEVQALSGAPGVRSARFAGPDADDAANRAHLLESLRNESDRAARFRTVLAFVSGDEETFFEGTCAGHIIREERGEEGFGYDSIFIPEGDERTFAEMNADDKNVVSHRARAMAAFVDWLRNSTPNE